MLYWCSTKWRTKFASSFNKWNVSYEQKQDISRFILRVGYLNPAGIYLFKVEIETPEHVVKSVQIFIGNFAR